MVDVVVSRYNEDLSWLSQLPSYCSTIVYNKGNDSNLGIQLPNVGGETHTFLHHIVSVYDKLHTSNNDYIAFVSGNPFQHYKDLIEFFETKSFQDNDISTLSDHILECDSKGYPQHPNLPLMEWFRDAILQELPEKIIFGKGGQFIIHKRLLHRKKLEYFMNMYFLSFSQPILPYLMERTWIYAFK